MLQYRYSYIELGLPAFTRHVIETFEVAVKAITKVFCFFGGLCTITCEYYSYPSIISVPSLLAPRFIHFACISFSESFILPLSIMKERIQVIKTELYILTDFF